VFQKTTPRRRSSARDVRQYFCLSWKWKALNPAGIEKAILATANLKLVKRCANSPWQDSEFENSRLTALMIVGRSVEALENAHEKAM
jgi:hypothetical protein